MHLHMNPPPDAYIQGRTCRVPLYTYQAPGFAMGPLSDVIHAEFSDRKKYIMDLKSTGEAKGL